MINDATISSLAAAHTNSEQDKINGPRTVVLSDSPALRDILHNQSVAFDDLFMAGLYVSFKGFVLLELCRRPQEERDRSSFGYINPKLCQHVAICIHYSAAYQEA